MVPQCSLCWLPDSTPSSSSSGHPFSSLPPAFPEPFLLNSFSRSFFLRLGGCLGSRLCRAFCGSFGRFFGGFGRKFFGGFGRRSLGTRFAGVLGRWRGRGHSLGYRHRHLSRSLSHHRRGRIVHLCESEAGQFLAPLPTLRRRPSLRCGFHDGTVGALNFVVFCIIRSV